MSHAHEPPRHPGEEQTVNLLSEPPAGRLAYSVSEVAQVTGLSRDLLYDQMRAGRLGYLKIGRRRIITRQQLHAFLTRGTR